MAVAEKIYQEPLATQGDDVMPRHEQNSCTASVRPSLSSLKTRLYSKEAAQRALAVPESRVTFDKAAARRIAGSAPFKGMSSLSLEEV